MVSGGFNKAKPVMLSGKNCKAAYCKSVGLIRAIQAAFGLRQSPAFPRYSHTPPTQKALKKASTQYSIL